MRAEPVNVPETPGPTESDLRWQRWLQQQLEPFLGQDTIRVNDLIQRLLVAGSKGAAE